MTCTEIDCFSYIRNRGATSRDFNGLSFALRGGFSVQLGSVQAVVRFGETRLAGPRSEMKDRAQTDSGLAGNTCAKRVTVVGATCEPKTRGDAVRTS